MFAEVDTIEKLADKIITLLLYTRKVTETKSGAFGLKERLLFCLTRSPLPPRELMEALGMVKSNLALLANKCIEEGLIEKTKQPGDRRTLVYSLTEKGKNEVASLTEEIEKKFATVLTDEGESKKAAEMLDSTIELLSYIP